MMQFLFYYLMISMNIFFMMMNHPMSMGLILLLQTIILSINSSMMNCWYSYMLFIIFIGGMLVLFIYVTSLASNEMFSFYFNVFYFFTLFSILMFYLYLYSDKLFISFYKNQDTMMYNINIMNNEYLFSLYKLYNFPTNLLSILLMIYLLIALIASVKITLMSKGPLRQKFN